MESNPSPHSLLEGEIRLPREAEGRIAGRQFKVRAEADSYIFTFNGRTWRLDFADQDPYRFDRLAGKICVDLGLNPEVWRDEVWKGLLKLTWQVRADTKPLKLDPALEAGCGELKPKRGLKFKTLAAGFTSDACFEAVYVDGGPAFLAYNGEQFTVTSSFPLGADVSAVPPGVDEVPYPPYGHHPGEVKIGEVYGEVFGEVNRFLDLEEHFKHLIAVSILLTYQQHKFRAIPYLYFYGDIESGKTTALDLIYHLAYRPMKGTSFPAADIYTYLEGEVSGCILEDEVGKLHKDSEKVKIYKIGYKRPGIVPRILTNPITGKRTIKYYNAFCFKAVANEKLLEDRGLMDRFIPIQMVEGYPEKDEFEDEDFERFQAIRNKLLKWRMVTWKQPPPSPNPIPVKGRLKELWKPVLQVAYNLPAYNPLTEYLNQVSKERRAEREESLEGKLVKVVWNKYQSSGSTKISFQEIWWTLQQEVEGYIDERKPNLMQTGEYGDITKNTVGYRLREVLGGKRGVIKVKGEPVRVYSFNPTKLERLAKKYHIEPKLPGYQVTEVTKFNGEEARNNGVKKAYLGEKSLNKGFQNTDTPQELGKLGNLVTEVRGEANAGLRCSRCGLQVEDSTVGWTYVDGKPLCLPCLRELTER